ncbi:sigma-54 dependent transcriptional regulator [Malonomonas rubra]|uniref:sigma-54-dependent transcriptional regulator n=1 Tax=Malonomonas rubra TaxID=57040 RepID=UPI0026F284CD|nr:sigma-54 dependent transcriptional regulator [Malonomonas rubra]
MNEKRILIIDDEVDVCNFFKRLLAKRDIQVVTATNEKEALSALENYPFSVAMVDLKLPDTDGLTLLQYIKNAQPSCEVIIMTGFSTIKTAVQAMQCGAFEYIEKPFDDIDELETLIDKAADHVHKLQTGQVEKEEWDAIAERVGFFVGRSLEMRRMVGLTYKIAAKNINILIQGDTGTGKEVLARFIHAASNRADQPFIAVNCGALPENLLESELFGHERGAFTGANQSRRGIFELAHRGTLFLDEIGDASPSIQVKLLRVLETGEFCRVGSERPIKTDVRIISATNVDLEKAIEEKSFREDLYYRLNVVRLSTPTLAQRREDIKALSEHLIRQYSPGLKLHPKAAEILENYSWPGNIRELANILRRAVALCDGNTISVPHLSSRLSEERPNRSDRLQLTAAEEPKATATAQRPDDFWQNYADEDHLQNLSPGELNQLLLSLRGLEKMLLKVMRSKGIKPPQSRILKESEAEAIKKTLEENRWNITASAKILGIARNTLHRKIKTYGLDQH